MEYQFAAAPAAAPVTTEAAPPAAAPAKKDKKAKKYEAPAPTRVGKKKKKKQGPPTSARIPTVAPATKCKLRLLKLERVRDHPPPRVCQQSPRRPSASCDC